MRNFLILLLVITVSCRNTTSQTNSIQKDIIVKDFNEYNGRKVENLKGLIRYTVDKVIMDSTKFYGIAFMLDTLSENHILYAFMEETPDKSLEKGYDYKIICGLKIENLSPEQIENTCNSLCSKPNSEKDNYFVIIKDFDYSNGKNILSIHKAFRLDFKNSTFKEIAPDSMKCEIYSI